MVFVSGIIEVWVDDVQGSLCRTNYHFQAFRSKSHSSHIGIAAASAKSRLKLDSASRFPFPLSPKRVFHSQSPEEVASLLFILAKIVQRLSSWWSVNLVLLATRTKLLPRTKAVGAAAITGNLVFRLPVPPPNSSARLS